MIFKTPEVQERFPKMHPICQRLAVEMDEWARDRHGIELTITATVSTIEEDKALGRVSATHREGRAFDIRTHDLPAAFIQEFLTYFTSKHGKLGAVTGSGPSLIVYKPHGTGPHFHVQIRRGISSSKLNRIPMTHRKEKENGQA